MYLNTILYSSFYVLVSCQTCVHLTQKHHHQDFSSHQLSLHLPCMKPAAIWECFPARYCCVLLNGWTLYPSFIYQALARISRRSYERDIPGRQLNMQPQSLSIMLSLGYLAALDYTKILAPLGICADWPPLMISQ